METLSPYAPPVAVLVDAPEFEGSEHDAVRQAHIRHEIQVKSIGALYYFGGFMLLIGGLGTLTMEDHAAALGVFFLFLGVLMVVLGYGFRRLRPWVRIPGGILSAIGLLGVPIGTIIHGWILYLMFCEKGRVVLGPDYSAVIAATPKIKYRRNVGDWIATGIVFGVLALIVVGVLVSLL